MIGLARIEREVVQAIIEGLMNTEWAEYCGRNCGKEPICDLFGDSAKSELRDRRDVEEYIKGHIYHFPFDTSRSTIRTKQNVQISVFFDETDCDKDLLVVESVVMEPVSDYHGFSRATVLADVLADILARKGFKLEECHGTSFDRVGFFGHQWVVSV